MTTDRGPATPAVDAARCASPVPPTRAATATTVTITPENLNHNFLPKAGGRLSAEPGTRPSRTQLPTEQTTPTHITLLGAQPCVWQTATPGRLRSADLRRTVRTAGWRAAAAAARAEPGTPSPGARRQDSRS